MTGGRLAIFSIVFGVFYFVSFYYDLALFRYYPEVSQFHFLRNDRLGVVILWYGWIVTSALASAASRSRCHARSPSVSRRVGPGSFRRPSRSEC